MQLNSKSIFLRRVREAQLLKKISKRTANHFISVYKKFDSNKRSEADEKADELLAELITESTSKQSVNYLIAQHSISTFAPNASPVPAKALLEGL